MDVTAPATGMFSAFDWLLCFLALVVFLKPRFDQWPTSDTVPHVGSPRDYIHWGRYTFFVGLYFASFVMFVTALKMIPVAGQVLSEGNEFSAYAAGILGQESMVTAVMIALAALSNKQVAALDDRWRSSLLTLARVPREAMTLAQRLQQNLHQLIMAGDNLEATLAKLSEQAQGDYWHSMLELPADDPNVQSGLPLLRALYIIHCCRHFELGEPDRKSLEKYERRLFEIAGMLPGLHEDNDSETQNEYRQDIKAITDSSLEILARQSVKNHPDQERRITRLAQQGFRLGYSDQPDRNIIVPTLMAILSVAVVTVLTLILGLQLFDMVGLPRNGQSAEQWLHPDRVINWGSAAVVSYTLAIAIGTVFGLAMQRRHGPINAPNAILAVVFSTLASCVYFQIASEQMRPPLIWLSLSFGLLSLVTLVSLNEDIIDLHHVRRRALHLALMYGLASSLLQVLIYISFAMSASRPIDVLACTVFAVFGFIRGFPLAFLVAHIIMDFQYRQTNGARRRYPRFPLRRTLPGTIGGQPRDIFIKDISEQGAMLRLASEMPITQGDAVSLDFDEGDIRGTVVWTDQQRARVRFQLEDDQLPVWQSIIRQKLAAAA